MARTSRRFEEKKELIKNRTVYKAAIYARLSNERTEEWRDKSSSIETQTLVCKEYALKENIQIIDVFADYEYSGTNFNRPEFQNMMKAIKERKINCIIVKDLSRLGREYLEMGRLIDKVFPFLGVRFIAVSDKLDTIKDMDTKKSFEVTIKNIVNDMYAKDISIKVKTSKINRAKNGYFIGSVPPYGYKVIKEEKGQKLIVDQEVRFIIEEIFRLGLEGKSLLEITKNLNEKNYATPMVYYKTGKIYREENDPQWHVGSVGKMLINQAYAGDMVQGIQSQSLAEGKKKHLADKKDHIVVLDTHEAIISRDDFMNLQKKRKERKANSVFSAKIHDFKREPENRFQDLIFSGKTGEKLYRRYRIDGIGKKKVLKYLYRIERFNGSVNKRDNLFIMEDDLDKKIISDLRKIMKSITNKTAFTNRIYDRYSKTLDEVKNTTLDLDELIRKEECKIQKNYEEYSLGNVDRNTYLLERDISQSRIKTIEREKSAQEDMMTEIKKDRKKAISWVKDIFSSKSLDKLSKELVESLIEKVIVYANHEFEVVYKFNMESLKENEYE